MGSCVENGLCRKEMLYKHATLMAVLLGKQVCDGDSSQTERHPCSDANRKMVCYLLSTFL